MKKTLSIFLVFVMSVAFLSGCSGSKGTTETTAADTTQADASEDNADGKITIGYTSMDAGHPYFVSVMEGLKQRCDELGIELLSHDPKWDSVEQVNGIENFVAMGVDAILISPVEPNAVIDAVEAAKAEGIRVIGLNTPIINADANITVDEYAYGFAGGVLAGEWIATKLNGEAEVALLVSADMEQLVDRAKGVEEGILSIAPNANIVSKQPGNKLEEGMKAAETVLQSNPNVKVFAGVNDAGALGALESIIASGVDTDGFYIGGLDATEEALSKIQDSSSIYRATVDLDPPGSGVLAINTVVEVLESGPISEYIYMEMKSVKQDGF